MSERERESDKERERGGWRQREVSESARGNRERGIQRQNIDRPIDRKEEVEREITEKRRSVK